MESFQLPLRKDRSVGSGGGVAIYVRNNISCIRRLDLEQENCECLWVEIPSVHRLILLGAYYRPPGQLAVDRDLFLNGLENSIISALDLNPKMLLVTSEVAVVYT